MFSTGVAASGQSLKPRMVSGFPVIVAEEGLKAQIG